ncbi:hypothetical protein Bca4012_050534 [Brassica carinata]|uniref:Uncharacterized protein n=1 Tax=Brassica carinata TaxID=52824 RepID=A0A8X7R8K9_BRACI|nr:hypothetical protein Bca52824_053238 [Brassica carinata]
MLLFLLLNSVLGLFLESLKHELSFSSHFSPFFFNLSLFSHLGIWIPIHIGRIQNSKKRPPGVKASKTSGKKTVDQEKQVKEFERIWTIKHKDMEAKERLSKMSLLESLIGKKEPLPDYEEALKKKLINDLF